MSGSQPQAPPLQTVRPPVGHHQGQGMRSGFPGTQPHATTGFGRPAAVPWLGEGETPAGLLSPLPPAMRRGCRVAG